MGDGEREEEASERCGSREGELRGLPFMYRVNGGAVTMQLRR